MANHSTVFVGLDVHKDSIVAAYSQGHHRSGLGCAAATVQTLPETHPGWQASNVVVVAIARELSGFVWDIGRRAMPH